MKRVYLDTNVFLSPFRMHDQIFEAMERVKAIQHLELLTGPLTLAEAACVLSREEKLMKEAFLSLASHFGITEVVTLSQDQQIQLALGFLLRYYNVTILDDYPIEPNPYAKKEVQINPVFKLMITLASRTQLRTLDQMHFCYTQLANKLEDDKVDYLLTCDTTFLSKKELIVELTETIVISPDLLVTIES